MHRSKALLLGASLCCAASPVFADGEGAGSAATDGGGTGSGSGATLTGAPIPMAERPFVLPQAGIIAYGDLDLSHFAFGMTSATATQFGVHLGGGYGVNDKITVGAEYAFPLAGDGTTNVKGKGPLRFYGMYQIRHDAKWSIAAEADLEFNFAGALAPTGGGVSTTEAIHVGLDARITVRPKFCVFTGSPFGPGVPGATGALVFPGLGSFVVGQHLSIGLNSGAPTTLAVPIGAGYQATPELFVYLDTVLTTIAFSNSKFVDGMDTKSIVFIGDDNQQIPINLGGFYSVNQHLDAGLNLFDNLKHPGDIYVLALAVRWTK